MKRVITILIICALIFAFFATAHVQAQITPPSALGGMSTGRGAALISLFPSRAITQTTVGRAVWLADSTALDLQYVASAAATNTLTVTVRHSNDGVHWVTGSVVGVGSVTSTVTGMTRTHNYGAYTSVEVTLANTNTITVTVLAVAR